MTTSNTPQAGIVASTLDASTVIVRIGHELQNLARQLDVFQHDLSDLFAQAHVSSDLMTRLQFLDGTTQSIEDLSRAAAHLSSQFNAETPVEIGPLREVMRLGALKNTILAEGSPDTIETQTGLHTPGQVSLF